MESMRISLSGLDVEWRRLEISAQNLANAQSTAAPGEEAYQPVRLISGPAASFATQMLGLAGAMQTQAVGAQVVGLEPTRSAGRRVHEPDHPHADAQGYVTYPSIDHAAEMTLMLRASRTYEANLAAISIAQEMYSSALDMGRQS